MNKSNDLVREPVFPSVVLKRSLLTGSSGSSLVGSGSCWSEVSPVTKGEEGCGAGLSTSIMIGAGSGSVDVIVTSSPTEGSDGACARGNSS